MPFSRNKAYVARKIRANGDVAEGWIAMNIREEQSFKGNPIRGKSIYVMDVNNAYMLGLELHGEVISEEDNGEIEFVERIDKGKAVTWIFTPLTTKSFALMKDHIVGYHFILDQVSNDADLAEYFIAQFVFD